jgi:hypothetical protein
MLLRSLAIAIGLALFIGNVVLAEDKAQLGSPQFYPSPERPIGFHGDGMGKYPAAHPPVHWSRIDKRMQEFKCAAAIPKDNSANGAEDASWGYSTRWLVVGPIACTDLTKAIKEELTPSEASLAPQEGDKIGNAVWKLAKTEDSILDLRQELGQMTGQQAAYAQTCLYVSQPMKINVHLRHGQGAAFWFNGAPIYNCETKQCDWQIHVGPVIPLTLKAGWNRFLFKVTPMDPAKNKINYGWEFQCFLRCRFWSAEPHEYQQKNITWISPMPGVGLAQPIVVGDNIITTVNNYNVVCADKNTGKVRWVRTSSMYDSLSAEDRKANPAAASKLDEMAVKRDAYYRSFVEGPPPGEQAVADQKTLEKEMDKIIFDTWKDKYKEPYQPTDGYNWSVPTPVSDGKNVYIWNTLGVSSGYDLSGKRLWVRYDTPQRMHHNWFGGPTLVDGKFVVMDGNMSAYNPADGTQIWRTPMTGVSVDFPTLVTFRFAQTDYICDGISAFVRVKDGVRSSMTMGENAYVGPVIENDLVFQPSRMGTATIARISGGSEITESHRNVSGLADKSVLPTGFWENARNHCASPVILDGLGYMIRTDGVLTVVDIEKAAVVYQKNLAGDIDSASSNPWCFFWGGGLVLAGPNLYAMGPTGITVVFKPGRKYEEVTRNKLEHFARDGRMLGRYCFKNNETAVNYPQFPAPQEQQESTIASTPIFEGSRMYYHGQENLYCIEEK